MIDRPIAIYGANGHTGRLVAAELAGRRHEIVLAGRNAAALHAVAEDLNIPARVHLAELDDPRALRTVTENAAVVINCAGPFANSGTSVASAALATRSHYLDHSAEPRSVRQLFGTCQIRARVANVLLIPGMSFYGALADLLAAHLTTGMRHVDSVTVAYAVDGWRMTAASKATATFLIATHRADPDRSGPVPFTFPPPIGTRTVLPDYPTGEVITIPRHVPTRSVRALMTTDTFADKSVFTSEHLDPAERAGSTFTIVVEATSAAGVRSGHLRGRDIYRVGAIISAEAASDLANNSTTRQGGVVSAAEAFPPREFLDTLQHRSLFELEPITRQGS